MSDLTPENPLLLFGCGNMGRAMLDGWFRGGVDPVSFIVIDPAQSDLPGGVRHHADASLFDGKVSKAIVAVKPQVFPSLATQLDTVIAADATVLSVMAGIRTPQLASVLPGRTIVRLMPNLAASLGKSPLGLFTDDANPAIRDAVTALVAPLGTAIWIDDEDLMDAVTALAGSGPAFVYRFIDALAQAGEAVGLSPSIAAKLAMAMIGGAVDLAESADGDPVELARRVTSPGGTTAVGLAVLDEDDALVRLITATIRAARNRGIALAKPS